MSPDLAEATAGRPSETQGSACPHCGLAVEASEDEFCCHGCEIAYSLIHSAGLDRYYEEREALPPRPVGLQGAWSGVPVEVNEDGSAEVRLGIDGLRCASCVWVTERVLDATPGVIDATVSYASGRATLRWQPELIDLEGLVRRIAQLGYQPRVPGEESRTDRRLLTRLGVAVFAALNVMLASAALYAGWWGPMEPRFVALFQWTSLLLATPVALWCAEPFFTGAWSGLKHRTLSMDVPVSLAVLVLYGHGVWATLNGQDAYLDSLTMLVALLLGGRVLESHARRRAAEAALALAGTVPASARRIDDGSVRSVPANALEVGQRIQVASGEEVAADGVVTEGEGAVHMALLTGESVPARVGPGDRLVAGAVLERGSVVLKVEAVGQGTVVRRMAASLGSAMDRSVRESRIDRWARWFTGGTLLAASMSALVWWRLAGLGTALETAVAVLVVACPCALALSRPLAAAAGMGAAARRGLLLRSQDALLDLARVSLVALDKTGTVTEGELTVVDASDTDLRVAAALERHSVHPIARAVIAEAAGRGIPLATATEVREEPGVGVSGVVDGREWTLRSDGAGGLALSESGSDSFASIRLSDTVRSDTYAAARGLADGDRSLALLSGDTADIARRVASDAGIDDVHAPLLPEEKAEWIEARRDAGARVLFVGDGLNDGPGLAAADVGLAMDRGAASSVLVADGVVTGGSLWSVVAGMAAGRAAERQVRRNQIRSVCYNVAAVGAAAAGLINPLVAAVLMPLSSLWVVWGATRVEPLVRRSLADVR